jgi:hypothetical protein
MLLVCELVLAWQELYKVPCPRYSVHKIVVHAYDHFNFPLNQNIYLLIYLYICLLFWFYVCFLKLWYIPCTQGIHCYSSMLIFYISYIASCSLYLDSFLVHLMQLQHVSFLSFLKFIISMEHIVLLYSPPLPYRVPQIPPPTCCTYFYILQLCNLLWISKLKYPAVFILNFGQFHTMYYSAFCHNPKPYCSTPLMHIPEMSWIHF